MNLTSIYSKGICALNVKVTMTCINNRLEKVKVGFIFAACIVKCMKCNVNVMYFMLLYQYIMFLWELRNVNGLCLYVNADTLHKHIIFLKGQAQAPTTHKT